MPYFAQRPTSASLSVARLPVARLPVAFLAAAMMSAASFASAAAQDAPAAQEAPAVQEAPAAEAAPAEQAPKPDTVIATINGETVTEADLAAAARDFGEELARVPEADRRAALIDAVVDLKLIAQAAEKAGLGESEEFKRRLDLLRARALRSEFVREKVATQVTEEVMKKRYDEEIAKITPPDEVQAAHILVETEDEAKAVIAELEGGADFATLAKEKSKDPGSAANGGDLGYFTKGQMVPEFEAAAFELEPGSVTETPVQTQFGWHVIKVVDKRKQPLPDFEDIEEQLRQMVLTETYIKTLQDLKDSGSVEIVGADADADKAEEAPAEGAAPAPSAP